MAALVTRLQGLHVKSLYCCSDLLLTANAKDLNREARNKNISTMWEIDEIRDIQQGTDAYGVSFTDMFEMAFLSDIQSGLHPVSLTPA